MSRIRTIFKDLVQGNSFRRLWSWSEDRMGFGSRPILIAFLFLPHLGMAWCAFFLGIAGVVTWPFGGALGNDAMPLGVSLILIPFGGLFCCLLTPMLLGRQRIWLDRREGSVRLAYGLQLPLLPLFLPLFSERRAFSDFERVVLTRATRKSGKNSYSTFAIELGARSGTSLLVADERGEVAARRIAEDVAQFVHLPLQDVSSAENSITREPEKLDEPLRERLQREGATSSAEPAKEFLATYENGDQGVRIAVPRPPFKGDWALRALVLCALSGALAHTLAHPFPDKPIVPVYAEDSPSNKPAPSLWPWRFRAAGWYLVRGVWILACVSVPLLSFGLLMHELNRPAAARIEADATGLRVWKLGRIFGGETAMPASELEELRVEASSGGTYRLVAVSDRRFLRFGHGLSQHEARYLVKVLKQALAK
ncbi:MAG: hypothetical protein HS116_03055 [Planctomycetes bacterium]|nr:hypothetical protein [Planctomycetota bacterium]